MLNCSGMVGYGSAVLSPGCLLELPGKVYKILKPRFHQNGLHQISGSGAPHIIFKIRE